VAGSCKRGTEPSGSIRCGEFLDLLRTGNLLKKDSAAVSKYIESTGKFKFGSGVLDGTLFIGLKNYCKKRCNTKIRNRFIT